MFFIENYYLWYIQYVLCNFYTLSYTSFIWILSKFCPVRSFDCRWNNNLIILLYKRNICFYTWKLNFVLFLSHFLVNISTTKVLKLFKCCFLNVEATLMDICWLKFHFQLAINVETTLGHRLWIDVILSMLFQRCFVNVEKTSINIRRLNFHFKPNFNVGTTLVYRRWINVNLSTLFQRCFANVETTSINVRRLNLDFQPNINIETTLKNVDDQRCFNVDSTLMCLPG